MRNLKVALIQMNPKPYELEYNLNLFLSIATKAIEQDAKLIVLPELFDSGYSVDEKDFAMDFSKINKNETLQTLSAFAKKNKIHIIACSIEKDEDKLYDTAYIIDSKGTFIGKQRKMYLWGGEKQRFSEGEKQEVFELDFDEFRAKIGVGICYEIGFSEVARTLALKGAEILIYPSAFGKARAYVWDLASRARALENGCYILACNRSGEEIHRITKEQFQFAGCSRVIDPKGEVITQVKSENECLIATIDIDQIYKQREALPYLKDIHTKLSKGAMLN